MSVDELESTRVAERFGLPGVQMAHRLETGQVTGFCTGRRNADGDPMTPDTLLAIGSVGKLFTTIAAAQACDAGLADIDASLGDGNPEFQIPLAGTDRTPPLRLRHLLSHAAGVKEPPGWTDPASIRAAVAAIRHRGLLFEPGHTMSWSNGGFVLAAAQLELMTNTRFEDIVTSTVMVPLGLRDTAVNAADAMHRRVANHLSNPSFAWMARRWNVPAGTMLSTATDLVRLGEVLCLEATRAHPIVISNRMRCELLRPTIRGVSGYSAAYSFTPAGRLADNDVLYISGTTDHGYADLRVNLRTTEVVAACSQSPAVEGFLSTLFPTFDLPTMGAQDFVDCGQEETGRPIANYEGTYVGDASAVTVRRADSHQLALQPRDRRTLAPRPGCVVDRVDDRLFLRRMSGGLVHPVRFPPWRHSNGFDMLHFGGNAYVRA